MGRILRTKKTAWLGVIWGGDGGVSLNKVLKAGGDANAWLELEQVQEAGWGWREGHEMVRTDFTEG